VLTALDLGDLSGLRGYVRTANANNREVSSFLVARVNFQLHTEGVGDPSLAREAMPLIRELREK